MWEAIAGIIKLVSHWVFRRDAKSDLPDNKQIKARERIHDQVRNDDAAGATADLNDTLAQLRLRRDKNSSGSGGSGS